MCTTLERHSAQVDVPLKPRLYRHPHGICAVDAEYLYPGHAAAHIIEDGGRAAFVDVGTNASVPYLLAALVELGIAPEAVDYVLLTHVHLDHAGGAGGPIEGPPQPPAGWPPARAPPHNRPRPPAERFPAGCRRGPPPPHRPVRPIAA